MKRFAFVLTAVGALTIVGNPVMAADRYFRWGHGGFHHARDHARLNHRAQHRAMEHHDAHHHPMTYRQHARLHYRLNREAAYDRAGHHAAHDFGLYSPYYGHHGIGISTPGFSFWLGR